MQQLVQRNSEISDEIKHVYNSHINRRTRPSIAEYSKLLQSEVRRLSKVFVIIDALDECQETDGTRKSLLSEIKKLRLEPNLHLLITARPHIDTTITYYFHDRVSLEIRASDEDIKNYLQDRIEEENKLKSHVNKDRNLQETIISTIVDKAKGM